MLTLKKMSHTLHSLAGATPKTRAEICSLREVGVSQRELMKRYSVSKATTSKWRRREENTKTQKTVRVGRTPCSPPRRS
jgi:DNA-binding transcriptional regulator YiaG